MELLTREQLAAAPPEIRVERIDVSFCDGTTRGFVGDAAMGLMRWMLNGKAIEEAVVAHGSLAYLLRAM